MNSILAQPFLVPRSGPSGRLLIVALFLIIGIRNLQKFHVDDHIARLTKFKAPFPRVTFWVGQTMEFVAWLKGSSGLGHGHAMAVWEAFKRNGWIPLSGSSAAVAQRGRR